MNILKHRKKKYSSIGNDGIIEFILSKTLNIKNGVFVEFGAWDGIKGSNCRALFERGWVGLFIESDKKKYKKLVKNYADHIEIGCVHSKVGFKEGNRFDDIVDCSIGEDINIDFCSIDIDGLDLDVFETFERHFPTVICIEGGQMLKPNYPRVSKSISSKNIQQSLSVITKSFAKSGYKPLCSYQDTFFIKDDFYHLFNVSSNIASLYFDGLKAIPHRLPFISRYVKKVGLKNSIVDSILRNSKFEKYGWAKRKKWVKVEHKLIISAINMKRKEVLKKWQKE